MVKLLLCENLYLVNYFNKLRIIKYIPIIFISHTRVLKQLKTNFLISIIIFHFNRVIAE